MPSGKRGLRGFKNPPGKVRLGENVKAGRWREGKAPQIAISSQKTSSDKNDTGSTIDPGNNDAPKQSKQSTVVTKKGCRGKSL